MDRYLDCYNKALGTAYDENKRYITAVSGATKKRVSAGAWFDKSRINNYLRITIGTNEQMEMLIQALREILERN